jgi:hypothetical protein
VWQRLRYLTRLCTDHQQPPHDEVGLICRSWFIDGWVSLKSVDLWQHLGRLRSESAAANKKPVRQPHGLPTIWRHGVRADSADGHTEYVVTDEEDSVLTAFRDEGIAMDTDTLTDRSGVQNVSRTITRLRERYQGIFAAAVRSPVDGKKGGGGYYIRVRDAEP